MKYLFLLALASFILSGCTIAIPTNRPPSPPPSATPAASHSPAASPTVPAQATPIAKAKFTPEFYRKVVQQGTLLVFFTFSGDQQQLTEALEKAGGTVVSVSRVEGHLPIMVANINQPALDFLNSSPQVSSVQENELGKAQ
jgi:hypothetical protein